MKVAYAQMNDNCVTNDLTTTTLKASHISLLPYGPPNHCWDNPPSPLVCTATTFIVPACYSLTCPLWHGPFCAPEAGK
ncbi:hypothetical protein H5410_046967 [Solanum commersonii]|uniref:Uncharacterized protein n=1 Tax=Solanum commersonii TaxID=4109 RepID=A0A9J5XFS3_SOLCO|nr:hypothetical protein H5410_046967 [Solanum commersonii]